MKYNPTRFRLVMIRGMKCEAVTFLLDA